MTVSSKTQLFFHGHGIGCNGALNEVPLLRAKAVELAQTDCKARKVGSKLRLTVQCMRRLTGTNFCLFPAKDVTGEMAYDKMLPPVFLLIVMESTLCNAYLIIFYLVY